MRKQDCRAGLRALLIAAMSAALGALSPLAAAQSTAAAVRIYDATELPFDGYAVIERLGVEGRESAFRIRGHADLAAARAALVNEATRLGADGVMNVICFDQTDRLYNPAGFYCYGSAIRIRNERRVPG